MRTSARLFLASNFAFLLACGGGGGGGTSTPPPAPPPPSPKIGVAAGAAHALALKANGTVWSWGSNFYGQLGDGTKTNRSTPAQVPGLSSVVAINATINSSSSALKSDGTVWSWGRNDSNQLGDGTGIDRVSPTQVTGLSGVTAIAAGNFHTLALKSDGTVWAWGTNGNGQLGDGTTVSKSTPVQVSGLSNVIAIEAGWFFSVALKADGTVWAWGSGSDGEIGNGTTPGTLSTPTQAIGLNGITHISAGVSHALARKSDGTVWAWGTGAFGEMGQGNTTSVNATPIQVLNVSGASSIAAGFSSSFAVLSSGAIKAWGLNTSGQLGDGSMTNRTSAVDTSTLNAGVSFMRGSSHTVAVKSDGSVWNWGVNSSGQLGDGTTNDRTTPAQIANFNLLQ
jgi:alpha-tubulin suppressor-like RCC1 family protein